MVLSTQHAQQVEAVIAASQAQCMCVHAAKTCGLALERAVTAQAPLKHTCTVSQLDEGLGAHMQENEIPDLMTCIQPKSLWVYGRCSREGITQKSLMETV